MVAGMMARRLAGALIGAVVGFVLAYALGGVLVGIAWLAGFRMSPEGSGLLGLGAFLVMVAAAVAGCMRGYRLGAGRSRSDV